MLLQMVDQLNAQRVSGKETLHLHEEMHGFAEALLKAQPVVFRRGGRDGRVRDTVHTVLRVRVN